MVNVCSLTSSALLVTSQLLTDPRSKGLSIFVITLFYQRCGDVLHGKVLHEDDVANDVLRASQKISVQARTGCVLELLLVCKTSQ